MKLPLLLTFTLALLSPLVSAQEIKLLPSDGATGDFFGKAVAISDSFAVVGARHADEGGEDYGAAYVFDTSTGAELWKLRASDGTLHQNFGADVGVSGDTAIIGAGSSAYLFDLNTGTELHKLLTLDDSSGSSFGESVAISGTTAIVGAWSDNVNGHDSGSAYLFDATSGTQIAKLLPSGGAANDQFGWSVAISGTTAIVGSRYDDDNGSASGSAYLFDTSTGSQTAKLLPSDGWNGDDFGNSVAISGTTAIVGAPGDDDNGNSTGSAYLFDTTTGAQIAKLLPSDGARYDEFGYSVAISGTTAIVGAYRDDDTGSQSGSAYRFDTTTGGQIDKLVPSDGAEDEEFGYSVAINGAIAIVGAWLDDDNGTESGSAYLFPLDCNNNGVIDTQEIANAPGLDCDQNGFIDECELAVGIGDCNLNGIFDACECLDPRSGVQDCNGNLIPDLCEPLPDCDSDGLPDECEIDCDSNGTPDDCEVITDCNLNGTPDDCEEDCNENGKPDDCDIADLTSQDCNTNSIPDECDLANGTPDCDNNDIPDSCEIANGAPDQNGNGIPDSCECLATNYCTASPNTAGPGVLISITGTPSISLNSLGIDATGGPTNQPGLFFHGPGTASQTFGEGIRCVSTPIFRVPPPVFFGGAGNASKQLDMNAPALSGIQPADTRYFQLWYRDPPGGPAGFNLSNGLEITFCP